MANGARRAKVRGHATRGTKAIFGLVVRVVLILALGLTTALAFAGNFATGFIGSPFFFPVAIIAGLIAIYLILDTLHVI